MWFMCEAKTWTQLTRDSKWGLLSGMMVRTIWPYQRLSIYCWQWIMLELIMFKYQTLTWRVLKLGNTARTRIGGIASQFLLLRLEFGDRLVNSNLFYDVREMYHIASCSCIYSDTYFVYLTWSEVTRVVTSRWLIGIPRIACGRSQTRHSIVYIGCVIQCTS